MVGRGAMSNSIEELADARLILAVGTNTTESHPVLSLRVKEAVRRGASLIVVDPRRIELTSHATRWLRLRIGSDTALFNAMAHVIIEEGLENRAFVARSTKGFAALRQHLEEYTPQRAAEITGIPVAEIVAAAREYATTRPASIIYTLGITEHACGTHNVQSLANLALLCGNFGLPSSGVNPLRGQNNVQGAGDMGCLPNVLPGYQKVDDDAARVHWEDLWGTTLPARPGMTKITALSQMLRGSVRAAYIMGENTVVSDANAAHTRRALQALDFLVVQDLFLTETAAIADVVLPAAGWAEAEGTYVNTERRVQRVRRAVPPPGEARDDWRIIADLSARMGYPMAYAHASEIWNEVATATPILAGISWQRLEEGGIQWPCPTAEHPGTRYLHSGLHDGDQLGYFQPVHYVPPAEPPDAEYPFVLTTGRRRPAYHTQTQTGRAAAIRQLVPHEAAEMHPEDAERLGVANGAQIRISSRRGTVTAPVRVTDRSPPGVVFLSFHYPGEVWTNLLTTDAYDPITETPEFKACAVRIEPCARIADAGIVRRS
jgi:formate dehydrogenase major subunit